MWRAQLRRPDAGTPFKRAQPRRQCLPTAEEKVESGFFDLSAHKQCLHPEHEPPGMIHIPYGKGYRHVCPACGRVVEMHGSNITL